MAKGYWIASIDVVDPQGYKEYVAAVVPVLRKYGARYVIRGAPPNALEGTSRSRVVVLEFADYETALACYNSPDYAVARAIRRRFADSDIVVIEGYDGPQPDSA